MITKPIPGWDRYAACDDGTILGLGRWVTTKDHRTFFRPEHVMQKHYDRTGYLSVELWDNGLHRRISIARLVCTTFHGAPPTVAHMAHHLDGDHHNNAADNLCWRVRDEVIAARNKRRTNACGEKNIKHKLTEDDVREIRAWRSDGIGATALSRLYGVAVPTIYRIASRAIWRHVP